MLWRGVGVGTAHQVGGPAAGEQEIFHCEVAARRLVGRLNLLLGAEVRAPHF